MWPRYALPLTVVLKKFRGLFVDDGQIVSKEEEFENEKAMYRRLKSAQGRIVPEFYGEAKCEGKRALVVSLLPGVTLRNQTKPRLSVEEFTERITVLIRDMERYSLIHTDTKLSNIMLVDGRIMFIDLEWVEEPDPNDLDYYCSDVAIPSYVRIYKEYLQGADKADKERDRQREQAKSCNFIPVYLLEMPPES